MRKRLFSVLLVVVAFMGIVNVKAMSEDELKAKVSGSFDINGVSLSIPKSYIKQLNDYLNEFEVSSDDCQYIADQVDILVNAAKTKGVKSISDFRKKCASEIKTACANVSANTKIKATVLSDGSVSVSRYNSNEEYSRLYNVIQNTGLVNILCIAGIISVLGAGLLVFKLRKA